MDVVTKPRERTTHSIAASAHENPYERASFSLRDRLRRLIWQCSYLLLYRVSPRPFHTWRAMILRVFGAKIGRGCHFYPAAKVWAPWTLVCEDYCTLADGAEIYNPSAIYLESNCVISQQAYICGATHDYNHPDFPMISYAMRLGTYSWICARACVGPGVHVGAGAVLGIGSVATRDLEPWTVYSGAPAMKVKERQMIAAPRA